MTLWVERTPMFFARRRRRRDLAKVTTLALAQLAYLRSDKDGGDAQQHFEAVLKMYDTVMKGRKTKLRTGDFTPSTKVPSGLIALTRPGVKNDGPGGAVFRVFFLKTTRRPGASISDDLLRHEQIHVDMFALGCILVNFEPLGAGAKKALKLQPVLQQFSDEEYDETFGKTLGEGTDHGRHLTRQREFWNSGAWVPPFVKYLRKELNL
jgi:hypothetical protein